MRKSRFTDEQIIGILQESAAGAKTADLIRCRGISRETFYNWRRKYGGLEIDEPKRLRSSPRRIAGLTRVVADQALNIHVLKDLLGKNADRDLAATRGPRGDDRLPSSPIVARCFTAFARSTQRTRRRAMINRLRTRLETLAPLKPSWGYRRLHGLPRATQRRGQ